MKRAYSMSLACVDSLGRALVNRGHNLFELAGACKWMIILAGLALVADIALSRRLLAFVACWWSPASFSPYSWAVLHLILGLFLMGIAIALLGRGRLFFFLNSRMRSPLPGTAAWLSAFKAGRILGRSWRVKGLLFGRLRGRPVILAAKSADNSNVMVIGSPGSMKSRAYVRCNILQCVENRWSMLITDPKGELARDFRAFLLEAGYQVRVLNLVDLWASDCWNPLSEIRRHEDVELIATAIMANTALEQGHGDPFWERAEINLLKALLHLAAENAGHLTMPGNLASVYRILCSGSLEAIDGYFSGLPEAHPARGPYRLFKVCGYNVQSGIVGGLGSRLQLFQNPAVQRLTGASDIDMGLPGQTLCAYFCIVPDTGRAYHFISALFISLFFQGLVRQADARGGALEVPVCALLDEFCNIGKIPDFMISLATMRSRGLFCSLVIQSLVQLKEMYGESFEVILAQCDSWLVLGVNDYTTAQYLSDCMGDTCRDACSYGRRFLKASDLGNVSSRAEARRLMSPDELRRMPSGRAILMIRGQNPLKIEKMDYTFHPLARSLRRPAYLQPECENAPTLANGRRDENQNGAGIAGIQLTGVLQAADLPGQSSHCPAACPIIRKKDKIEQNKTLTRP